ncbi:MAG: hypothetical protein F6K62_22215, partial [Sphaerospermopsis sp. SIO1G2]|nr:hypothetical protein [Sphaerospermopsis sp. SIO1G2]
NTVSKVGLSHQELQSLTNYSLSTIKAKGSEGKTITTKDGTTYRYDKDAEVVKWLISNQ